MRKYLFSLLLLILALSLVACGPGPASKDPDNDQPGDSLTDTPEEVSVEEQTLIDQDGIVIKATGIDSSWLGPELKVYIENNTDKAFTAQTRNSSVNGFMLEPVFSCDVMPGKKATGAITFAAEDLEACGIDRITDIEFSFYIFDADSWNVILESDIIVVKTSAANSYKQVYNAAGVILFDTEDITIVYQGVTEDPLGLAANLYIENNSNEGITLEAINTSVNGFMIEPAFICDVMPRKRALDTLLFYLDELAACGIEKITEIELNFHIINLITWDTIINTEKIKIEVE